MLVTLKVQPHVWNLRARRTFMRVVGALGAASDRFGVRIVLFSVQRDHAHLIVEVTDRASLGRSIKGLCVRIARTLNRIMGRRGSVFADRYHDRVLTTPRQTRHAISYVLCNARKHGLAPRSRGWVDPCSSGNVFEGWSREIQGGSGVPFVVAAARTWLLRAGWRRAGGAIDPAHHPGRAPT